MPKKVFLLFLTGVSLLSCGRNEFKIEGEINGAEKQPVVLEKADYIGQWIILDSTRTSKSGHFKISHKATGAPDIYRLVYGNQYIYLPIDSTETITVKSTADNFTSDYKLDGSVNATQMGEFDREIATFTGFDNQEALRDFKRRIYSKYIQPSPASIVSYYILTKSVGNRPLFNPEDNEDYKYFGSVATGFKELRPDDPRTRLLTETALNALKRRNSERGNFREIEANEINLLEIELPDEKGKNQRLSDLASQGKPTILVFSMMTTEDAPVLNYELEQLRKEYNGGINIYQVSLDPDRYSWREAAANLPWITVYDPDGEYSRYANLYNVEVLPSFYIINSQGELSSRAFTIPQIKENLKK